MELEHDSKSSKSKNSELINEIEMYKNELDDIKTKCSYLSNEVQSTHRQVVEAKSDLEEKDRVLANKDIKIVQYLNEIKNRDDQIFEIKDKAET